VSFVRKAATQRVGPFQNSAPGWLAGRSIVPTYAQSAGMRQACTDTSQAPPWRTSPPTTSNARQGKVSRCILLCKIDRASVT
jgi:hypothetical protein